MFINIVQNLNVMGFLGDIWEFITRIFSMLSSDSRAGEEKDEEKIDKKIAKDTKEEEHKEKEEESDIELIIKELKKIEEKLSESPVEIRVGQQVVTIAQALEVLIDHLEKLTNTKDSVTQEEIELKPIEDYWLVVRQGLRNAELHNDVEEVSFLFKKLNIELGQEKRVHHTKIQLVKKQWELIQEETKGSTTKKGELQEVDIKKDPFNVPNLFNNFNSRRGFYWS